MSLTPSTMLPLGTVLPPFELPDFDGKVYRSADLVGTPLLVLFICNHCPYVKHFESYFTGILEPYHTRGIEMVAINSNDWESYPQDGPEKMKVVSRENGYFFPYLLDETQEIARSFKAACTPDFFLFDQSHTLVYRGQFDASRPGSSAPITGADLCQAMDAYLEGREIDPEQIPSVGCNIKWRTGNEPEYV